MNNETDIKRIYEFTIRGSVDVEYDRKYVRAYDSERDKHLTEEYVYRLNSNTGTIEEKISNTIERQLPSSFGGNVKIKASLEFGQGSITWMGVITALDWLGRIVDTVTFTQMISSAIGFAVKKVIAQESAQFSIPIVYETISTTVIPNFVPLGQTELLYRDLLIRQDEQVRILRGLSRNFDNLLRYIGQLQRRNSAFRILGFRNDYMRRPSWISRDTLILLILAVLTIIQAINYFGIDTIKGWFSGTAN